MRPVLAITHLPGNEIGLLRPALESYGIPLAGLSLFDDGLRPRITEVAGIVSFGGMISALDQDDYPFLRWEIDFLEEALNEGTPVLGLCLGAQLLATAGGGRVERLQHRFVRWVELSRSAVGVDDPLFRTVSDGALVIEWHEDAIEMPPSGVEIMTTVGPGCSIFRVGTAAWGSQLHLELTTAMLQSWLRDPAEIRELVGAGVEVSAFEKEADLWLPAQIENMRPVFEGFARLVIDHEHRTTATSQH
jgi:GMP synthase (glutamine-hydrolysing)